MQLGIVRRLRRFQLGEKVAINVGYSEDSNERWTNLEKSRRVHWRTVIHEEKNTSGQMTAHNN